MDAYQRVVNELATERAVEQLRQELEESDQQPASVRLRRVQEANELAGKELSNG